jgi:phosphoribosylglycinamide formyltransferase 1
MSSGVIKHIVILISGNGTNLQAIIDHQKTHQSLYEVDAVISNNPDAFGLTRAKQENIKTFVTPSKNITKDLFSTQLCQLVSALNPDLIVLAGFMKILSPAFIKSFPDKIINIHPSLLPKYKGLRTHERVMENNEKIHGATVHHVTEELDAGEIIGQFIFKIENNDNLDMIIKKVHQGERLLFPKIIEMLSNQSIKIEDGKVISQSNEIKVPINLLAP